DIAVERIDGSMGSSKQDEEHLDGEVEQQSGACNRPERNKAQNVPPEDVAGCTDDQCALVDRREDELTERRHRENSRELTRRAPVGPEDEGKEVGGEDDDDRDRENGEAGGVEQRAHEQGAEFAVPTVRL